jgi:hypothetical protein
MPQCKVLISTSVQAIINHEEETTKKDKVFKSATTTVSLTYCKKQWVIIGATWQFLQTTLPQRKDTPNVFSLFLKLIFRTGN